MQKTITLLFVLILATTLMATHQLVQAQQNIITVPDDYSTITEAIHNAQNGDTVYIKSGTYHEQTITINKTITLIGENMKTTTINLHPPSQPLYHSSILVYDNPIQITADQVTISNFTITSDSGIITIHGIGNKVIDNYLKTSIATYGNETQVANNEFDNGSLNVNGYNNTIANNTLIESVITFTGSWNKVLNNSLIKNPIDNPKYYEEGILLTGSENLIMDNKLVNCSIFLEANSNDNTIAKNNCLDLRISRSSDNTVTANYIDRILGFVGNYNTFRGNYMEGLRLGYYKMDTPNNIFYENIFNFTLDKLHINNSMKVSLIMDNGSIGNYWHTCQNTTTDAPYVIYLTSEYSILTIFYGVGNIDNYELTLTDRYPLTTVPNISEIQVQLPQWVFSSSNSETENSADMLSIIGVTVIITLIGTFLIIFARIKCLKNKCCVE